MNESYYQRIKGVIIVNLGTPDSTEVKDLRKYLKEFLSDARVLTAPAIVRWLLLRLIILPFRPKRIKHNYEKIWTKEGSPLMVYSLALLDNLRDSLGDDYKVELAMRYRLPSLKKAIDDMIRSGVDRIRIVPLFPQYASATTGSIFERVAKLLKDYNHFPAISFTEPFYDAPFFIDAQAEIAKPFFEKPYDHVVFTYHGVPKTHLSKDGETGNGYCQCYKDCCQTLNPRNQFCYGAQCHATSQALAKKLNIPADKYTVSYQSRFGPTEWIQPYTTDVFTELGKKNTGRVIVLCPAFVADCVETLEEIQGEERDNFLEAGGKEMDVVPCVNDSKLFATGMAEHLKKTFL